MYAHPDDYRPEGKEASARARRDLLVFGLTCSNLPRASARTGAFEPLSLVGGFGDQGCGGLVDSN